MPYSRIFVPTADTVRFGVLLTLALQVHRPVLLTGMLLYHVVTLWYHPHGRLPHAKLPLLLRGLSPCWPVELIQSVESAAVL